MKTEELLKPRFKVTGDYPHSLYKVGEIIDADISDSEVIYPLTQYQGVNEFGEKVDQVNFFSEQQLEKYNSLFRKLEWYEDRKLDDLPEYVKYADAGGTIVYKVDEYDIFHNTIFINGRKQLNLKAFLIHTVPTTKEEYEAHQSTQ